MQCRFMNNQSLAASVLCKPIGAKLRTPGKLQLSVGLLFAHQQIPLGAPLAQYNLSWSVQKLRRLSLHDTNIAPIWNNKMQPASSFTFIPVQLYSTCD
jgi:hypothetical protein